MGGETLLITLTTGILGYWLMCLYCLDYALIVIYIYIYIN